MLENLRKIFGATTLGACVLLVTVLAMPAQPVFSQTVVIPDCPSVDQIPHGEDAKEECGPDEKSGSPQSADKKKKEKKES